MGRFAIVIASFFSCLLLFAVQAKAVAPSTYTLRGCTITAGKPSTIDDGPQYSPFLTTETVQTSLTLSNEDPENTEEEIVGDLSDPTVTWTVVGVQMAPSGNGTRTSATNLSDYSFSGTDPNATPNPVPPNLPMDGNSSGSLGFDSPNSKTTNLWGTFSTVGHFWITVQASVTYTDQGGNTWSGSAQKTFVLVAGNWVSGPSTNTPTNSSTDGKTFIDHRLADPEYGDWFTEYALPGFNPGEGIGYKSGLVHLYSRTVGSTNGEASASITPTSDPGSCSLSEQEVWVPADTSARGGGTFQYQEVIHGHVYTSGNLNNGGLGDSTGATAAGIKATIDSAPAAQGGENLLTAVSDDQKSQGSDGTYAVGIGLSFPPSLGLSVGTTLKSSQWEEPTKVSPTQGTMGGSITVTSQNRVIVKTTLFTSSAVEWTVSAGGPFWGVAEISIDTYSLGTFKP